MGAAPLPKTWMCLAVIGGKEAGSLFPILHGAMRGGEATCPAGLDVEGVPIDTGPTDESAADGPLACACGCLVRPLLTAGPD